MAILAISSAGHPQESPVAFNRSTAAAKAAINASWVIRLLATAAFLRAELLCRCGAQVAYDKLYLRHQAKPTSPSTGSMLYNCKQRENAQCQERVQKSA